MIIATDSSTTDIKNEKKDSGIKLESKEKNCETQNYLEGQWWKNKSKE